MALSGVAARRSLTQPRISWAAIFLKAYGIVSNQNEILRQCYMTWPLPHLYQHGQSIAMLSIHRDYLDRPRLCWGRWIDPGSLSLVEIQHKLNHYQQMPVERVFQKQLQLSLYPQLVRRWMWWVTLSLSGHLRARQVGTFSISTLAGQGIDNRDHPTICTSSLSYGPLDRFGSSSVTLIYDHRILDGMQAAQCLQQLRSHLLGEIYEELDIYRGSAAA